MCHESSLAPAQEGQESHDAFMASLTSHKDSQSLMPADSAFRMVSSVPADGEKGGKCLPVCPSHCPVLCVIELDDLRPAGQLLLACQH